MTIFSKNLGGHGAFGLHPGYAYVSMTFVEYKLHFAIDTLYLR